MTRTYKCLADNCSNLERASIFYPGFLYQFHLYLSQDQQNPDYSKTIAAKKAGLIPFIIPETYDDYQCLNATTSTVFKNAVNSWNFNFSGLCQRKYCYKIIPNINIDLDIQQTTRCYRVMGTEFLKGIGNQTTFGELIDANDIESKIIGNKKIPEITKAFTQPYNSEFAVVHYEFAYPHPISTTIGFLLSVNDFHNVYYLSPYFPYFRSIFDRLNKAFYTDFKYTILALDDNKLFQAFHIKENIVIDSETNYFGYFDSYLKDGVLLAMNRVNNETTIALYTEDFKKRILYTTSDDYDLKGGLVLLTNFFDPDLTSIILIRNKNLNKYQLLRHSTNKNQTTFTDLPKKVPNVFKTYPYARPWSIDYELLYPNLELQDLFVTGMSEFNNHYRQWSVIYGNFFAISNTFTRTYYLTMSFKDNETVTSFYYSNHTSRFAFLTSRNMLYYGDTYSNIIERVPYDVIPNLNMTKTLILFDSNENLDLVDISNPKNPNHFVFSPEQIPQGTYWCPFQEVFYEFSNLDYFTRLLTPIPENSFPKQIYVDHSDTFHFKILATYTDTIPNLFFTDPLNFNLTYTRNVDYTRSLVAYSFWIKDGSTYDNYIANNYTYVGKSERIDFFFENSSSCCKNFHTYFDIKSGCMPGLSLEYRYENQEEFFTKEPMEFLKFSAEWNPKFYIYDSARDIEMPYDGLLEILIVGYGEREYTFRLTDDPQINSGNTERVFAYKQDPLATAAISSNNTISWLCQIGSVCNRITPKLPEPPSYYFKLRARTIPRNLSDSSFCTYEKDFYVKVSGIPMDVVTMAIFLVTTLIFLFLIFGVMYYYADNLPIMSESNKIIVINEDDM
ncbi:hypothetical protein TRFO_04285 [Tritrichomonas foetus]|uniref:CATSPERG C-terminal domain-containing protein n=1 Tax=Tritrichomonas foetus TaxID=1144522 RepID=A0A1J4KGD9_9EUKA|nr:hypothetical protein TRFO_04285 [Tritrichomonas foetus]|eukprot:OHT10267.1 hypothetical protein TRFO_04285 [Tritrichomonas foetus]